MNRNGAFNNSVKIFAALSIILLLAACGPVTTSTPTPTLVPSPNSTIEPSRTVTHTLTSTVQPTLTPSPSPTVFFSEKKVIRFDDLGIVWIECELPISQGHTEEECLGVTKTSWRNVDVDPFSVSYTQENGLGDGQRLIIGKDIYESVFEIFTINGHLSYSNEKGEYVFNLYKNGDLLFTKITQENFPYDPNILLVNINGKYAWEFAQEKKPTIFYDGIDIAQKYEMDGVYRASVIADKLIYIARKNGKAFIALDSKQLGPLFDHLSIGSYCCEPAKTVERRPGQYWFWGMREGKSYAGVITEIAP